MRGDTKQKILLLISAGVALGFSRSPKNYFKIIKGLPEEWKEINKSRLYSAVREFYNERIIDYKEDNDGNVKIILTKEGQKKALPWTFKGGNPFRPWRAEPVCAPGAEWVKQTKY